MTRRLFAAAAICHLGCASSATLHTGKTTLASRERAVLARSAVRESDGFRRSWRRRGVQIGLVKWDGDRSSSVAAAPRELLQAIRDEIGRLNRYQRAGEEVRLSVTVFEWRRAFFTGTPEVGYEVVGRDRAGQLLWMAEDVIHASSRLAVTLAEEHEQIVARELARRLKKELGL
jgi:hypothetical protein